MVGLRPHWDGWHDDDGDRRPNTPDPANGRFLNGETNAIPNSSDPVNHLGIAAGIMSAPVIDLNHGVERNPSNGNVSDMDCVQENIWEGREYSIGANNNRNRNRQAPRPVGTSRRMGRKEVREFWGEFDGSGNNRESC